MSNVLYRKHRPQTFAEIRGQETSVQILTQSIISDKIAHAYLFAGPRGTGKTTIARLFTKALNDPNFKKKGDIDPNSDISQKIAAGRFVDLVEIDAASNRGIEEVRQLKEQIRYMPSEGKYKVYIIDEVHMLTREAFNALLKTLEEPPAHVVFLLATTEPHKLPSTILSRVQRYDFRLATAQELRDKVSYIAEQEGYKLNEDAHATIFQLSGGSFRDAESLVDKIFASLGNTNREITNSVLQDILGLIDIETINSFIQKILNKEIMESIELIREIYNSGGDIKYFLHQVITKLHKDILENSPDLSQKLGLIGTFLDIEYKIKSYEDTILIFEVELLKMLPSSPEVPVSQKSAPTPSTKAPKPLPANKKREAASDEGALAKQWLKIVEHSKGLDKKVWTTLKLSKPKMAKNKLEIYVRSDKMRETLESSPKFTELKGFILGIVPVEKVEIIISGTDKGVEQNKSQNAATLVESNEEKVETLF